MHPSSPCRPTSDQGQVRSIGIQAAFVRAAVRLRTRARVAFGIQAAQAPSAPARWPRLGVAAPGGPPGGSRRASRGSPPAGGACRVGRIEGTSPVCALAHEHTCTQSVVTIGRSRRTWSGFLDQVLRLAAIGELAPRGDISRTSLCSAHCAAVPVSRRAVLSKFRPFVPI